MKKREDLKGTPYSEEVSWETWTAGQERPFHPSEQVALYIEVGKVLRIAHPDVFCDSHSCGLRSFLSKRKDGKWRFRHLEPGVALVYREK